MVIHGLRVSSELLINKVNFDSWIIPYDGYKSEIYIAWIPLIMS